MCRKRDKCQEKWEGCFEQKVDGEAGEELASPAAAVMARRESRAAMPKRLKVAARDRLLLYRPKRRL